MHVLEESHLNVVVQWPFAGCLATRRWTLRGRLATLSNREGYSEIIYKETGYPSRDSQSLQVRKKCLRITARTWSARLCKTVPDCVNKNTLISLHGRQSALLCVCVFFVLHDWITRIRSQNLTMVSQSAQTQTQYHHECLSWSRLTRIQVHQHTITQRLNTGSLPGGLFCWDCGHANAPHTFGIATIATPLRRVPTMLTWTRGWILPSDLRPSNPCHVDQCSSVKISSWVSNSPLRPSQYTNSQFELKAS